MAIADTITSMQNHTSNAYDMIEYGTDLTGTNKNLQNLSTSIFKAFIQSLNNPDTLWNNLPKIIGTGTNISLNNTIEAPMKIELSPVELSQSGTPTPSSPQDIHTINGNNKVVVCGKNLFDESQLTLTTTQVDNKTCYQIAGINTSTSNIIWNKELKTNTQYTISMVAKRVAYFNNITFFYTDGTTSYKSNTNSDFQTIYATSTANKTINKILIDTGDRYATNYIEVGTIQLEEGTTATTYEPYKGTDYSIDLRTYTNLFDKSTALTDKLVNASSGNVVTDTGTTASDFIYIKGLTNIILSGTTVSYGNGGAFYDKNKTYVSGFSSSTIKNGIAVPSNAYYVRFNTLNTAVDTTMLNKGTTALPYTPYNDIEYCKMPNTNYKDDFIRTSGKNLFDKDTITLNNGYYINNSGVKTSDAGVGYTSTIKVKPNTAYTINGTFQDIDNYFRVYYYDNTETWQSKTPSGLATSNIPYTFTTPANCYYVAFQYRNGKIDISNIMFNEGSTALPYEPYGSNEWYIKKNIGKDIFTGSADETWYHEVLGAYNNFYTSITTAVHNNTSPIMNNLGTYNSMLANNYNTYISSGGNLNFRCDEYSSVSDFKTMLGTTNMIVYFILATPTYTKITGTLAEQLEAVKYSKDGQTNISQVNNDLPFGLSVSALEDLI